MVVWKIRYEKLSKLTKARPGVLNLNSYLVFLNLVLLSSVKNLDSILSIQF